MAPVSAGVILASIAKYCLRARISTPNRDSDAVHCGAMGYRLTAGAGTGAARMAISIDAPPAGVAANPSEPVAGAATA
jgi:hypothetical protein